MHDDQLRRLLRSLEDPREPDPAFADALFHRLGMVARNERPRRTRFLLLTAALLLVALAAGSVAIGSGLVSFPTTANASPSSSLAATPMSSSTPDPETNATATASTLPSATAIATSEPTPSSPGAIVGPPSDVLPLGSMIRATADGLRVREGPSVTWDITGTVNAGDLLYITGAGDPRLAPLRADGYEWYPVDHAPGYTDWPKEPPAEDRIVGWIAARSASESFVELVPPTCPADVPDLLDLAALTPYERVACFGDETLTIEGTFGCPYCDSLVHPYRTEPAWLAEWTLHLDMLVPSWSTYPPFPGSIVLTTPPGVRPLEPGDRGSIMRVTGHFDDEHATTCTITPQAEAGPELVNEEAAEWYCRERFVVESWTVIGTDPAYEALIPG